MRAHVVATIAQLIAATMGAAIWTVVGYIVFALQFGSDGAPSFYSWLMDPYRDRPWELHFMDSSYLWSFTGIVMGLLFNIYRIIPPRRRRRIPPSS
jgi:hypothetical protein